MNAAAARAIGILAVWMLAALLVTTLRLFAASPRLLGTVVPATWGVTILAAVVGTILIARDHGGGGPVKLEIVLVILMLLGYALTPVLQRFWAGAAPKESAAERLLGTIGGVDVFAVRGQGRSVTIGSGRAQLAASEGIVLREHA